MGLCTVQALPFSKLPKALSTPNPSHSSLPITPTAALLSRSICLRNLVPRATTSEETPSGASRFFDEKRDSGIILDDVKPADNNSFDVTEDAKIELPAEEQGLSLEFLDKLKEKIDVDDAGSLVVYGGGALVALWLTSAIVGAIDSIPVIPKLLEVVGLAYTVWFSSRYLLFKKSREELVAKIEELKEQVLGSEDE